jgi:hypothetical protein
MEEEGKRPGYDEDRQEQKILDLAYLLSVRSKADARVI